MPLHPIEPRRLYRQIAEQLRALIHRGEFGLGQRLPPERDLAVQLGVSRPSVREALIALEVEGLVEVRMGSGIYVIARERAPSAPRVDATFGPFEVIRARQVLEAELAAIAAAAPTPELLRDLAQALGQMAEAVDQGQAPIQGDRQFHLRLAQAADNGPLLRTVTELYDERHQPVFHQLGRHFETAAGWRLAMAEHRVVLAAVAAGQPAAARAAMRQHLARSHNRLAEAWPQAPVPERAAAAAAGRAATDPAPTLGAPPPVQPQETASS